MRWFGETSRPLIISGAVGVPLGTFAAYLLRTQRILRSGVGLLLVVYGIYGLGAAGAQAGAGQGFPLTLASGSRTGCLPG